MLSFRIKTTVSPFTSPDNFSAAQSIQDKSLFFLQIYWTFNWQNHRKQPHKLLCLNSTVHQKMDKPCLLLPTGIFFLLDADLSLELINTMNWRAGEWSLLDCQQKCEQIWTIRQNILLYLSFLGIVFLQIIYPFGLSFGPTTPWGEFVYIFVFF